MKCTARERDSLHARQVSLHHHFTNESEEENQSQMKAKIHQPEKIVKEMFISAL